MIPDSVLMVAPALFRFERGTRRLGSVTAIDSPPARAVEVASHLIGAQWLWVTRLEVPQSKDVRLADA